MKKKWLLRICILCIGILGIAFVLWMQTPSEKDVATPEPVEEEQEKVEITGYVHGIHNHILTINNSDNERLQFEVTEDVFDLTSLSIKDEVSITYQNDHEKKLQKANYVSLIKKALDPLQEKIQAMSIEEKVGQMFMARCPSDGSALQDLQTYQFGGYMLFAANVAQESKASLKQTLASYQEASKIPLLISIDEEGGTVNRLSLYPAFRGVPFHSPQSLYEEGGMELILSDNEEKATLLLSLGINVNLAPVADVSTNPNDFIYQRSFGKTAQETADYIAQVVENSKRMKLGTTLKHFPGYGNNVDTHTGMALDERSMDTFTSSDFLPFMKGIEAGADSVLVNHNIVACMDEEYPASLSKNVHDILRNQLGFHGVIMSDDLDMDAIQEFSANKDVNPAVLAVQAGNDLILTSQYSTQISAVIAAIENGEIDEVSIDRCVYRILVWKQQLGFSI